MSDEMQVTAIIVDYYTRELTERLIDDLVGQEAVAEIIVVDNTGDPDYQVEISGVITIKNKVRGGFGQGANDGAHAASCAYLLVLNSDLRVVKGNIGALASALRRDQTLGLTSPTILNGAGKQQQDAGGRFMRAWWGPSSDRLLQEHYWRTGAAFMMRRDLFQDLGGFDERYFMYWEDVDLCRRLAHLGLHVGIMQEVAFQHHSGASDSSATSRYGRASKSRSLFMRRWEYPWVQRAFYRVAGSLKLAWLKWSES